MDDRLLSVFQSVLGDEADQLKDEDGPHSVESWDSIAHLNLILAIEAEYGVMFDTAEIPELLSLGKIKDRLES